VNIAFAVVKNINRGGGIEKYTLELGTRLVARGHNVRVYSMRHYGEVLPEVNGMEILTVPSMPLPQFEKLSASMWGCFHAAFTSWADVVHLHHTGPGMLGWLFRLRNTPALIQYHGLEWKRSRWGAIGRSVLKGLERWSVLCNTEFSAVSRQQCDYFQQTYHVAPRYIPTGADVHPRTLPQEILRLGLVPGRYVLFASRLVREKGAHYLIPAFRRLHTDCKLVIAGDVPSESAYKEELLTLADGDPRIIFPGFVEGRLLDELFSHALVYVQPSEIEGLSIALLEAMSYGLCCLVSDIPENREAIGDCGISFSNGDVDDLATKLADLVTTDGAAAQLSAKAVARVQKEFSWDTIADEFEQYYASLLSVTAPAPVRAAASLPAQSTARHIDQHSFVVKGKRVRHTVSE
jgi:glycosyltransferase involved in cell wall biosynthesis